MNEPVTKNELKQILSETLSTAFKEQEIRLESKFVTKKEFGNFVEFVTDKLGVIHETLDDMKP